MPATAHVVFMLAGAGQEVLAVSVACTRAVLERMLAAQELKQAADFFKNRSIRCACSNGFEVL